MSDLPDLPPGAFARVDEGDDADTWQTAQAIARTCRKAEVVAHITDPWMRDRLETYALMLRMNPHSRNDRMQIMRAIAASYADLLTMPPRGTDGKRVVAEGQRTNIETGETTTGEITDYV